MLVPGWISFPNHSEKAELLVACRAHFRPFLRQKHASPAWTFNLNGRPLLIESSLA
jgi:hypothetical protein